MMGSLALTALLMGLVGGPHCLAMCGSACAGLGQAAGAHRDRALWSFQLGRLAGYSALGAVAAASMQAVGWLSTQTAAMRPVWTMLHVGALLVGIVLLLQARQPLWLEDAGRRAWARIRRLTASHARLAPLAIGALWAFLPCGLLYSALLVAALAGSVADGASVMACFAIGSGFTLMLGPWLLLRLVDARGAGAGRAAGWVAAFREGQWGVRLAGAALAGSAGWALWMGLVHDTAPWCLTPAG